MRSGNSLQICGNGGIFRIPSALVKVWKTDLRVLKIDVARWWSLLRGAPQSFPPPKSTYHGSLFLDAKIISGWSFGDLVTWNIFDVFFGGVECTPKHASVYSSNNSFEFHFVSLNIMVSQRTPAKSQIKYCKFILMTRPNQKRHKHVLIHPFSKKNRGKKTPKKNSLKPWNAAIGPISSGHQGTRVLSCWCKYLKASEISRKTLILPTTPGWISENDLLEILYWTLHGTKRVTSWKNHSPSNVADASTSQTALRGSQWPYFYCYFRKVRRACITLDGMRLCFYPILSKVSAKKPLSPTGIL